MSVSGTLLTITTPGNKRIGTKSIYVCPFSNIAADVQYVDPRRPEILHGMSALNDNVCIFSAYAPGWSAKVTKRDIVAGDYRVTVAFSGIGSDGSLQTQLGQYFMEKDGELISRIIYA